MVCLRFAVPGTTSRVRYFKGHNALRPSFSLSSLDSDRIISCLQTEKYRSQEFNQDRQRIQAGGGYILRFQGLAH